MIQTFFIQKTAPERISRDSRGTRIEAGKRVSYNQNGNVIMGHIVSCESSWHIQRKWEDNYIWSCKFRLRILNEDGNVSIVKNPNSFVII